MDIAITETLNDVDEVVAEHECIDDYCIKNSSITLIDTEFHPILPRIAKFEKVSFEQFKEAMMYYKESWNGKYSDEDIETLYNNIKLPVRGTKGSAGYDFFAPFRFTPQIGEGIVIPSGIRCKMQPGWVLKIYPRSGQGFKYGVYEYNTVGIIDEDFYFTDSEGHIMLKIAAREECEEIPEGIGFCQGIFTIFGITEDDNVTTVRTGGLGSTTKVNNN